MTLLLITQALPNPFGKDRTPANNVSNDQLNGEWAEFSNPTHRSVSLEGLELLHKTFDSWCRETGTDRVMTFRGSLDPGQAIRVHSGSGTNYQDGSLYHFFVGRRNFIWNNRCGDTALLRVHNEVVDWAAYAGNPREGAILRRVPGTNRLA